MATNYIQEGDSVTLAAPYDRTSGQGALIGSLFGIALDTVLSGAQGVFTTQGVFELNKVSAQAWTVGQKVYWDDTNKECTTTAKDNTLIGVALEAAANPSSTGVVRLNGSF